MSKETFFKSKLLSHLNYSVWLQSVEDKILLHGKKCTKLLKLLNILVRLSKNHMKGLNHTEKLQTSDLFLRTREYLSEQKKANVVYVHKKGTNNLQRITDQSHCCQSLVKLWKE